ncbi:hypothetical protein F4811DRAFT_562846 [Daldinia bambusicola]|nr:hypothetical protein F4811DRAFT_562846 [Daldinia bambusicola]
MSFGSVAKVVNEGKGIQGKANPGAENDGASQYEWLLAKMAEKGTPNAIIGLSSSQAYQREYAMYMEIFEANIAKKGIDALRAEKVFHTPIWSDGNILFLDYDSSETTFALTTSSTEYTTDETPTDTPDDGDFVEYPGFNIEKYFFELNYQYYCHKDWFRCMVDSFWGPPVASVFQITTYNRPFIQISFKTDWNYRDQRQRYYEGFAVFLHVIARMRPIDGLGPLTDIFGFSFANFAGQVISEFESVARLGIDVPEGQGHQVLKYAVRHRFETWRNEVVTIKD